MTGDSDNNKLRGEEMHHLRSAAVLGCSLLGGVAWTGGALAESLGVIQVESTTIDDRFESKRGEPSNVSTISGEKVDQSHVENLQQVLQAVPGITSEFTSGGNLKIHIRGVENQRYMGEKPGVAVVIDGVPVFERTGAVNIDLDNIESIKVIKGGASYLFGDDALSGAVIITTKRGAKLAGYKVEAEVGSFDYHKYLARAGYADDAMNAHLQVSRRESDGYWYQSDYLAEYADGKVQWYLDESSDLTFGFEASNRNKDSHGSVEGVTQATLDPQSYEGRDYARMFDVALGKYYLTYARDVSDNDNLLLNAYQFNDHTKFVSAPQNYTLAGVPVTDVNAYTNGNDYKQVQRGIKSEYRSAGENLAWMAAVDLRDNSYRNYSAYLVDFKTSPSPFATSNYAGTVTSDNKTLERVQAMYGELRFRPADRLTTTLNGRYDHIALDYEDYLNPMQMDKSFDVTSWRLGGNYALKDNADIYANASTGFRAPSIEQLFAGTISPTGNTASNPDLRPEQSLNLELGLRGTGTIGGVGWDYDVAVFQLERNDYIMSSVGQYSIPASGEQAQYQNIGGMRSRGLEFSLRSDESRDVWMTVAYTYLRSEFTDYKNFMLLLGNRYRTYNADCSTLNPLTQYCLEPMDLTGNVIPRTPEHHLNTSLNYRPAPGWTLSGEVDAYSDYYADETNFVRISSRAVFNVLARYEHRFGGNNRAAYFLRVDNLFNEYYYNTARGSSDGASPGTGDVPDGVFNNEDISLVVNPGRVLTAGVSLQF
jgi:iron complex outermembrane receptor protein